MITETGTMTTEIIYSDDRKNRYLLRKTWGDGEQAMLLMTNAGAGADVVSIDHTTLYSVKNLNQLNITSVDIVNLTSEVTTKIEIPKDGNFQEDAENINQILRSAETADKIIIAWGKLGENNKKVRVLQLKLLEKLRPYADKLYGITNNPASDEFYHPLAPQIRFEFVLKPFPLPKAEPPIEEVKPTKTVKNKKSQATTPADLPIQESETTESA